MVWFEAASSGKPDRRTPLGARPLEAANIGARGYCGPAMAPKGHG